MKEGRIKISHILICLYLLIATCREYGKGLNGDEPGARFFQCLPFCMVVRFFGDRLNIFHIFKK